MNRRSRRSNAEPASSSLHDEAQGARYTEYLRTKRYGDHTAVRRSKRLKTLVQAMDAPAEEVIPQDGSFHGLVGHGNSGLPAAVVLAETRCQDTETAVAREKSKAETVAMARRKPPRTRSRATILALPTPRNETPLFVPIEQTLPTPTPTPPALLPEHQKDEQQEEDNAGSSCAQRHPKVDETVLPPSVCVTRRVGGRRKARPSVAVAKDTKEEKEEEEDDLMDLCLQFEAQLVVQKRKKREADTTD